MVISPNACMNAAMVNGCSIIGLIFLKFDAKKSPVRIFSDQAVLMRMQFRCATFHHSSVAGI